MIHNKKRHIKEKGIAMTAAVFGICVSLTSCGLINEEPSTGIDPEEKVTIEFTIGGNQPVTRADIDPDHNEIEESEQFENQVGISTEDYRIFIYESGNNNAIFNSGDAASREEADFRITDMGGGVYRCRLNTSSLKAAEGVTKTITVVALANLEGINESYTWYTINDNLEFKINQNGTGSWKLGETINGHRCLIPMYGRKDFTFTVPAGGQPTVIDIGDMYLLRALAKLQVIDAMPKDANGYPKITGVSYSGSVAPGTDGGIAENGMLVPNAFTDGQQVSTATLPGTITYQGNLASTQKNGYLKPFPDETMPAEGVYSYWNTYTPEMQLSATNPTVRITYMVDANNTQTAELPLTNLGTNNGFTGMLLRNHIYRMVVSMMPDATISLSYQVCPFENYIVRIPTFD